MIEQAKPQQNKMTYRDLLLNCCRLLSTHPELYRPGWIIIDEVQDCDQLQLDYLELLKKPETCLFAVGDPNQVIYSWRGSAFQIFFLLRNKYDARELMLPLNYRSSGSILKAARYFQQNGNQLEGVREAGSKIVVKNHYDAFQEADYLAGRIQELHSEGVPYHEIAVFYRLQNQSAILEQALHRAGIPAQVSLKRSIQDIPVLNWLIRVLRFALNPADVTSGVLALTDKQYGEGWTQKRALAALEAAAAGQQASGSGLLDKMLGFAASIVRLSDESEKRDGVSAVTKIPELLALDHYLRPTSATYAADRSRISSVLELLSDHIRVKMQAFHADIFLSELREFLNQSALYGMELEPYDAASGRDVVKLMTLHASKGLEFSHVFIIGANQGSIPLASGSIDAQEEERRLFFVGMTRAKEYLEISWYTSPDGYRVMPEPSRFLRMIPVELILSEDGPRGTKDAAVHLQNLKRQVIETKTAKSDAAVKKAQVPKQLRVRHQKYGEGFVLQEDGDKIIIDFDDYGEKEMMKMFTVLERI